MKKNSIRVNLEAWLYLQDTCHNQRVGGHLTEKTISRLTRSYEDWYKEKGKTLIDGDLGGAIGDPKNSYEEGRWTSWSVADMKRLLDEAGLPYEDGDPVESINIYI